MSKVASYLQEHILGEVVTQGHILQDMSRDASVISITPEMVIFPRATSDIRKVARFCWQLAEKGHILPITVRGGGSDQTGAAIGKGIVLSLPAHMNQIFEYEPKQKLIRLQPGTNYQVLNDALRLHGVSVPAAPPSARYSTVGGAIANNASGILSGKYGATGSWVSELEVVLANGEVLQTGRISRRDLDRRKGLQTFEGEIYRSLDNLIEDNRDLINLKLNGDIRDNAGYESLATVKRKDGSFDLTPLIIGSQGTLGIISEMIMKAEYISLKWGVAVASFLSAEAARDTLDKIKDLTPTLLNYYDGEIFSVASEQGRKYSFDTSGAKAVVIVGFDDFSDHARGKKLKKVARLLSSDDVTYVSANGEAANELLAMSEVTNFWLEPSAKGFSAPPLMSGAYVPAARFEEFSLVVAALAGKHHVSLPLYGRVMDNVYYTRANLQLSKVGDKQKILKLMGELSDCVVQHGGHLISEAGEGRVNSRFAYANIDDDVLELFAKVKAIFDPYGILNPGVKQQIELKELVTHLEADYNHAAFLPYVPYI